MRIPRRPPAVKLLLGKIVATQSPLPFCGRKEGPLPSKRSKVSDAFFGAKASWRLALRAQAPPMSSDKQPALPSRDHLCGSKPVSEGYRIGVMEPSPYQPPVHHSRANRQPSGAMAFTGLAFLLMCMTAPMIGIFLRAFLQYPVMGRRIGSLSTDFLGWVMLTSFAIGSLTTVCAVAATFRAIALSSRN